MRMLGRLGQSLYFKRGGGSQTGAESGLDDLLEAGETDGEVVNFGDLSAIVVDSGTPANDKNTKNVTLEDIYHPMQGGTYNGTRSVFFNANGKCQSPLWTGITADHEFDITAAQWAVFGPTNATITTNTTENGYTDINGDSTVDKIAWVTAAGNDQEVIFVQPSTNYQPNNWFSNDDRAIWELSLAGNGTVSLAQAIVSTGNTTGPVEQITLTSTMQRFKLIGRQTSAGARGFKIISSSANGDTATEVFVTNVSLRMPQVPEGVIKQTPAGRLSRFSLPIDYTDRFATTVKGLYLPRNNRTNLNRTSFNTPAVGWNGALNVTIDDNDTTQLAPWADVFEVDSDGDIGSTMDVMTETTASGIHYWIKQQNDSTPLAANVCASFLVKKKAGIDYVLLGVRSGGSPQSEMVYVYFDLVNGTITDTGDIGTVLNYRDSGVLEYADSVYRVWITFENTSTGARMDSIIAMSDVSTHAAGTKTDNLPDYTGSTGNQLYFQAIEAQYGDYLDVISFMPSANATSLAWFSARRDLDDIPWNDTEGTVLIKCEYQDFGGNSDNTLLYIGNDDFADGVGVKGNQYKIEVGIRANGEPFGEIRNVNADQFMPQDTGYTPTLPGNDVVIGISWKANDFAFAVDGRTAITDTSGSVPINGANLNTLWLGGGATTGGGWVKKFAYLPKARSGTWLTNKTGTF